MVNNDNDRLVGNVLNYYVVVGTYEYYHIDDEIKRIILV